MEDINAFEFAAGVYGLSIGITLLVWLVIVAIRWVSRDRVGYHAPAPAALPSHKNK